jgi:hypothetical protein
MCCSFPEMRCDHQTDATGELGTDDERCQQLFSVRGPLFADGERSGEDRRAGVNHGCVSIVVVLEMTQKTVRQGRVLGRGSKPFADHSGSGEATFGAQQVKQNIDGRVKGGVQRDAGVVYEIALRQVHDIGGDVVGWEVHYELCECCFSLSHLDPPFLLFRLGVVLRI